MPVGLVLMLSTKVPPDPAEEVRALAAQCGESGRAYLLTTKIIDMASYQRGQSGVALISEDRQMIAHGRLCGIHFYDSSEHLGPALYEQHHPTNPRLWVELSHFRVVEPSTDLGTLNWEYPHEPPRQHLTSARVPQGQGGHYFRAWHMPPGVTRGAEDDAPSGARGV